MVAAGDEVSQGQLLGRVTTLYGEVGEEIHAPRDGVVLFLTTSAAVSDDGLLLGLGAELSPHCDSGLRLSPMTRLLDGGMRAPLLQSEGATDDDTPIANAGR